MPFSQEAGYTATSIETIMNALMNEINTQFGTSYTPESFIGTNHYKFFYALAQRLQENEVKTSEIFLKLAQYISIVNERISRPVVTNPGIVEKLAIEGFTASVKPMIEADAGKINVCVDVDDGDHAKGIVTITNFANLVSGTDDSITVGATVFTAQNTAVTPGGATFQAATSNAATATSLAAQINAHATAGALVKARAAGNQVEIEAISGGLAGNSIALVYTNNDANIGATVSGATLTGGDDNPDYAATKTAICELLSQITVAGAVTQGAQSEAVVLSNGQSFDFKYHLPNRIPVGLRLTITLSENNQVLIGSPDETKALLLANIEEKYKLGKNFEPQRYFTVADAPWASQVLLEYTFDVIDGDVIGSPTYVSTIFDAGFADLFDVALERVELVEN